MGCVFRLDCASDQSVTVDTAREVRPSLRTAYEPNVLELIDKLPTLERSELDRIWFEYTGKQASPKLQPQLMYPVISYKIQERAFGGLWPEVSQLLLVQASLRKVTHKTRKEAKLLREWRGEMHEVLVLEDGFEYKGQTYQSLSRIARKITGTQWSGPAFFGTKGKK